MFDDDYYGVEDAQEGWRDIGEWEAEQAAEAIGYFAAQIPTPGQKYDACKALCDFFRDMVPEDDIPF